MIKKFKLIKSDSFRELQLMNKVNEIINLVNKIERKSQNNTKVVHP